MGCPEEKCLARRPPATAASEFGGAIATSGTLRNCCNARAALGGSSKVTPAPGDVLRGTPATPAPSLYPWVLSEPLKPSVGAAGMRLLCPVSAVLGAGGVLKLTTHPHDGPLGTLQSVGRGPTTTRGGASMSPALTRLSCTPPTIKYTHTRTYTYTRIYTYTLIHVCKYTHTHIHICVDIFKYAQIYAHIDN